MGTFLLAFMDGHFVFLCSNCVRSSQESFSNRGPALPVIHSDRKSLRAEKPHIGRDTNHYHYSLLCQHQYEISFSSQTGDILKSWTTRKNKEVSNLITMEWSLTTSLAFDKTKNHSWQTSPKALSLKMRLFLECFWILNYGVIDAYWGKSHDLRSFFGQPNMLRVPWRKPRCRLLTLKIDTRLQ